MELGQIENKNGTLQIRDFYLQLKTKKKQNSGLKN